jgi:hypothetical protein
MKIIIHLGDVSDELVKSIVDVVTAVLEFAGIDFVGIVEEAEDE